MILLRLNMVMFIKGTSKPFYKGSKIESIEDARKGYKSLLRRFR